MIRREFRQLMKEGRMALVTGVAFLIVCETIAQLLPATPDSWHGLLREGLTIIGWVAMWRPVEIYLYRWWPLLRLERVYRNLSAAQVEVKSSSRSVLGLPPPQDEPALPQHPFIPHEHPDTLEEDPCPH